MFPALRPAALERDTIEALLTAMHHGGDENRDIPAGYTYLAQFVDHDITFDPTSKLEGDTDPSATVNFRTPRFDLDSLYGAGPKDQPFLYDWSPGKDAGAKLLVGCSSGYGTAVLDLPRNQQGRALIGDARNDENLIVSQLHLLFIRFHNRVVDHLRVKHKAWSSEKMLDEAQECVRRHYQWIVMHDFLCRIVGESLATEATAERSFYKWEGEPFIPVEFSGAAYRFGHSMVRGDYRINAHVPHAVAIFADRHDADELEHLAGFRRLPPPLAIDWAFFFELSEHEPVFSRRLDTNFALGLSQLPADVAPKPELPRLNLLRGRALGLPAGSDVARAMGHEPLSDGELLKDVPEGACEAVRRAPPLWYYVLREAQGQLGDNGKHLGPVGGRIVAEVLAGLLEADPSSYVHAKEPWSPTLPRAADGDFTMPDLVRFTLDEAADALPPGH